MGNIGLEEGKFKFCQGTCEINICEAEELHGSVPHYSTTQGLPTHHCLQSECCGVDTFTNQLSGRDKRIDVLRQLPP